MVLYITAWLSILWGTITLRCIPDPGFRMLGYKTAFTLGVSLVANGVILGLFSLQTIPGMVAMITGALLLTMVTFNYRQFQRFQEDTDDQEEETPSEEIISSGFCEPFLVHGRDKTKPAERSRTFMDLTCSYEIVVSNVFIIMYCKAKGSIFDPLGGSGLSILGNLLRGEAPGFLKRYEANAKISYQIFCPFNFRDPAGKGCEIFYEVGALDESHASDRYLRADIFATPQIDGESLTLQVDMGCAFGESTTLELGAEFQGIGGTRVYNASDLTDGPRVIGTYKWKCFREST